MKNFFFSIVVFACFYSCKKERHEPLGGGCDPDRVFPLDYPDLLNMNFKQASYWIHFDSIALTSDSSYVTNPYSDLADLNGCGKYQVLHYNIQHTLTTVPTETLSIYYEGVFSNSGKIYINYSSVENQTGFYSRSYFDSLFIYDRYYKKVEKSTIFDDPSENHFKTVYYMNSEFGLLRKDIYNLSNSLIAKRLLIRKSVLK